MNFYTFGLQRTCTNFAKFIVEINFQELKNQNPPTQTDILWKHNPNAKDALKKVNHTDLILFCYKEPHMWLDSLFHLPMDFFDRFGGVYGTEREKIDIALDTFNLFYNNWIDQLSVCRYEVFHQRRLLDHGHVKRKLSEIARSHGLPRKKWTILDRAPLTRGDFKDRKQNYLEGKPRKLDQSVVDYVYKKIDKRIVDFFENQG